MYFLDLNKQYHKIKQKIDSRLQKVIDKGEFILGPEVSELEKQLALFAGVNYCITVGNGTDALIMALMVLDIKKGDEVITSPFTFAATAEAICWLGAVPVFVDIDAETYLIQADTLKAAVTEKTKAILPVSLFGQCADFDAINTLAARNNIPVIEDAAQSFGALYKGRRSCNLSTIACTSFFPAKPLGCYGDGGACFTNNEALADQLRQIRTHGQATRYQHNRLGMNSRLDTLQAAVLLEKLSIFPEEIEQRNKIADYYKELLPPYIKTPVIHPDNKSVYAQYTIQCLHRNDLQAHLKKQGISSAIHYPLALYQQPAFEKYCRIAGTMTHTEQILERVLSLPLHPYLEKKEVSLIAECIKDYYPADQASAVTTF